jgi:hypothetical protein
MDNPEKLGTQDEEKQNKTQHNTICIGVNRPNAKLVFDSISCHKCKNTAIHSTKEVSKVVAKGMIL